MWLRAGWARHARLLGWETSVSRAPWDRDWCSEALGDIVGSVSQADEWQMQKPWGVDKLCRPRMRKASMAEGRKPRRAVQAVHHPVFILSARRTLLGTLGRGGAGSVSS